MMRSRIKIKEDFSVADCVYKSILIKVRKFKNVIVQEEYLILVTNTFPFNISSYVETVNELCASLMKQIIKSPIWSYFKIINVAD